MSVDEAILDVMRSRSEPMTPKEVSKVMQGSSHSYVRQRMPKLAASGELVQVKDRRGKTTGEYALPESPVLTDQREEYVANNGDDGGVMALFREQAELEILTEVKASAGAGTVVYPDDARHVIRVPRNFIAQLIGFSPPRQVGIMFADGDSMEPTIRDEEMILYKPTQEVQTGGIYVLWRDTGLIVKRVQRLSGGGYRLISDNTYHNYTDETIVPEDHENGQAMINKETGRTVDLRVVGKVLFPKRDTDRLHVKQVAELIRGIVGGEVDPASLS